MPDLTAIKRAALLLTTAQLLQDGEALLRRAADQRNKCAELFGQCRQVRPGKA